MRLAATELRYEEAALLRDDIAELRLALVEARDAAGGTRPGRPRCSRPVGVTGDSARRPRNRPLAPPVASPRWPTDW